MAVRRKQALSKREEVAVGEAAATMAKSAPFERAIDGLYDKYFDQWKASKDVAARELIHAKISLIEDFINEFRSMESNAIIEKRTLES